MGGGFSKMKKQAKLMQEQMQKMQEDLKNTIVEGSSANNLVVVTITGEKELKKIKIDPQCVDPNDVEGLQDLICQAFTEALKKLPDESPSDMGLGSMLGF
ncbi:MAG: Nucleoid-associated protein [Candidatus Anoxychlamydiales bacterium]|nr:Nucleoid-associated protein [Candidatus Anoxychlamydiales bacterium]